MYCGCPRQHAGGIVDQRDDLVGNLFLAIIAVHLIVHIIGEEDRAPEFGFQHRFQRNIFQFRNIAVANHAVFCNAGSPHDDLADIGKKTESSGRFLLNGSGIQGLKSAHLLVKDPAGWRQNGGRHRFDTLDQRKIETEDAFKIFIQRINHGIAPHFMEFLLFSCYLTRCLHFI